MSSVSIKWEEPPADGRSASTKWELVANELKRHPGRWALVAEDAAQGIRSHLEKKYGLETRGYSAGRGYKRGRGDIYARYVGDSGE